MENVMYLGLDYHSRSIQLCALDAAGRVLLNRACANDTTALALALRPLGRPRRIKAAIEACPGAAELAEALNQQPAWHVELAHPGYVARLKQSPDKTDFSDAQLLADLRRVKYLPRVWLAPRAIRELRLLVREQRRLAGQRRDLKLRIGALLRNQRITAPEGVRRWTRAWQAWLVSEALVRLSPQGAFLLRRWRRELEGVLATLKELHAHLTTVTADDSDVQRLLTIPGVGLVTACELRAAAGRFDRFATGRQFARFCGLSPRNASSGQRQADAGLIGACDRQLRAALMETAHRLMRCAPRWRALGLSLIARGKPRCVAVAAVANRWARWLWGYMRQPAAPAPGPVPLGRCAAAL